MKTPPPLSALSAALLVLPAFAPHFASAADGIRSTNTYSAAYGKTKNAVEVNPEKDLPRYPAVAPADAVATWKVKPGFRVQLAAHEPQVRDPIAVCFDERGRMFVCEMIDYSERRDETPHLGRISMLEDKDGDGVYETSTVFADDLPWPTGLVWANGGLFVGATPDIWRLEDRDGDGRAEVREKVFTGFGTGLKVLNVQGLLNSFQWGLDNRIHVLAGGGNRGVITSPKRPELPGQELAGRDFWFDPRTLEFGFETGGAQYGMSFDNYGRRFGCANSDHLQHWVYDGEKMPGNGVLPMPAARRSIAADGGAAEVFRISPDEPWRIIRTRWRISGTVPGMVEGGGRVSGYFTGATGTTIYRGDAFGPGFVNNSFTGDAGGQLVHRKVIHPAEDGVSLVGERPEDERSAEFAASADTWVRVVNFANAPDGCLLICDMYREVIEHPWSIPEEIKRHLDLNSGNDRGRLYRLVPEKGAPRVGASVELHRLDTAALVARLAHPNGWHRDTAQRLLVERRAPNTPALAEALLAGSNPLAKLHALGVLSGLGALSEKHLLTVLADKDPQARARALLLVREEFRGAPSPELLVKLGALAADRSPAVRFQLALTLGALLERGDVPELAAAFVRLAHSDHAHRWIAPALLSAKPEVVVRTLFAPVTGDPALVRAAAPFVAQLVELRAATQKGADLAALVDFVASGELNATWLKALGDGLRKAGAGIAKVDSEGKLTGAFQRAAALARDGVAPVEKRTGALEILAFAEGANSLPALKECLGSAQPAPVQLAAVQALASQNAPEASAALIAAWNGLSQPAKDAVLQALFARADRLPQLLEALESGRLAPAALSAAQIQTLLKQKDAALAARAKGALASVLPPPRSEVTAKFKAAVAAGGDAGRGRTQFLQRCQVCHKAGEAGVQVGPDLVTVKTKGREALLEAILEPNKEVAAQYIQYTFQTRDGGSFAGIIAEDNASSLTLKMAGGATHTIQRAQLKGSQSTGQSLMPEGLEGGMSVQEMADLLTFIEQLP